ncbi:hypothetical protein IGI04_012121 [Brassica rapa subsp. trilocularis]|uniref:Uncharacterized protein n=1 Tax=Brassica rapa subsp. trilocularis TaxID=1813537 RepID=A0ABQ7N509_BRACM|nr:hypothetical protein IGI04_012121 [Brassica rapa subsp. trilocularis]
MLHRNGSGYVEAEGNVLEARFRKLPQGSDSDSDSEAGNGRPMKLPCNVGNDISFLGVNIFIYLFSTSASEKKYLI